MSLLKVSLLLLATVARHVSSTPPHPSPPSTDLIGHWTTSEHFLAQRSIPAFSNILYWTLAIAETAAIVASRTPSASLSKLALSVLVIEGSPERIGVTTSFLIGTFITCAGGWIRFQCYRTLGELFTFELTIRKDHRLVTTGPYASVRHPSYIGYVLTFIGTVFCNGTRGSWMRECGILTAWVGGGLAAFWMVLMLAVIWALIGRIEKEERVLRKRFGKEWKEWARRVPYRLVPGIY